MVETYITIQKFMTRDLKLKGNELIIYAIIHGYSQDGKSYFYGSLKYLSGETNLSKRSVLITLQSLVKKDLIRKIDTQELNLIDERKVAAPNNHFCLYYTTISRESKIRSGEESLPPRSKNFTGPGEESLPNNKFDNKYINSSSEENIYNNKQEEDYFLNTLKKYFDLNNFTQDFAFKVKNNCINNSVTRLEFEEYIKWAINYAKDNVNNTSSLEAYIYKLLTQSLSVKNFRHKKDSKPQDKIPKEDVLIQCPCCGTKHKIGEDCPVCELHNQDNPDEIEFRKIILHLPAEQKENLNNALEQLASSHSIFPSFKEALIIKSEKKKLYLKIPDITEKMLESIF